VRYDLIEAVLGNAIGTLPALVKKAEVLEASKEDEGFKESIEALSRVLNIASKAEKIGETDKSLFENEFETLLYKKFMNVREQLNKEISVDKMFELLISMKPEIDQYFEHTMVMAENLEIRENRLKLMANLADIIKRFANMNEIIVK